jgi:hypothetical protein
VVDVDEYENGKAKAAHEALLWDGVVGDELAR